MLIGLHGVSRSGKDSVASVLVWKYGFRQVALATEIRLILLDLNPWLRDNDGDIVQLRWLYEECAGDWDLIKARAKDSVEFMIRLGQSARDRIEEDVWLRAAFPDGQRLLGNIVISDIRQPNEVTFLHRHGGELWKIERPELGAAKRGMDDLLKDVRFDAHIVNSGTLQDLEETVDFIMSQDDVKGWDENDPF